MKYRIVLLEHKYMPQFYDGFGDSESHWSYYYKFKDVSNARVAVDERIEFDKQSDAKAFIDEKILEEQSKIPKVVWESDPPSPSIQHYDR